MDRIKGFIKAFLLRIWELLHGRFTFEEVSILAYHSVSTAGVETAVVPEEFEKHLAYLKEKGRTFVSLASVVAWERGVGELSFPAAAITFDDGYVDFETAALPILEKYEAPVTLFIVGDEDASRGPLANNIPLLDEAAVRRLQKHRLVELGYHSATHPNLAKLSPEELKQEVAAPFPARYFAYPGGHHSAKAAKALRQAGYEAAFSIRPTLVRQHGNRFLIPRTVVTKGMTNADIFFHTTRAAVWYRQLRRFFR